MSAKDAIYYDTLYEKLVFKSLRKSFSSIFLVIATILLPISFPTMVL